MIDRGKHELELVGYWKSTKMLVMVAKSKFSGRRKNLPQPTTQRT
jgi:hypothetical protein